MWLSIATARNSSRVCRFLFASAANNKELIACFKSAPPSISSFFFRIIVESLKVRVLIRMIAARTSGSISAFVIDEPLTMANTSEEGVGTGVSAGATETAGFFGAGLARGLRRGDCGDQQRKSHDACENSSSHA